MKTPIQIMLVDDHEMVLLGLRSLLKKYDYIEIIGEARNAKDAIVLAQQIKPQVILMDIRMPGESGIETCRSIKALMPAVQIIMLTSYDDDEAIYESIMAGASGYILKEIGSAELIHAINKVFQGHSLLDPSVTSKVMERIRLNNDDSRLSELTPQEKHVLSYIAQGKTNKEIGKEMMLSEKTIRNYLSTIFAKLELHNRAEAAVYAVRHKLDNHKGDA